MCSLTVTLWKNKGLKRDISNWKRTFFVIYSKEYRAAINNLDYGREKFPLYIRVVNDEIFGIRKKEINMSSFSEWEHLWMLVYAKRIEWRWTSSLDRMKIVCKNKLTCSVLIRLQTIQELLLILPAWYSCFVLIWDW